MASGKRKKAARRLAAAIERMDRRPKCIKCGTPDVLLFAGDACAHELRKEEARWPAAP